MQFPSSTGGLYATMGIGMAGALLSGLGERASGQQEQAAFNYNADTAMLNAGNEMLATEQRYSQLVGKQAAAYAASGVDITRGSPLLMMAATAGRGGRQQAAEFQQGSEEATLQRYYGKLAAFRGTIGGIGTFLSGISKSATDYLSTTGYVPGPGDASQMPQDFGGV